MGSIKAMRRKRNYFLLVATTIFLTLLGTVMLTIAFFIGNIWALAFSFFGLIFLGAALFLNELRVVAKKGLTD